MKRVRRILLLLLLMSLIAFAGGCGGGGGNSGGAEELEIAFVARYETPITNWDPAIISDTGNQLFLNFYEMLLLYDANTDSFIPKLSTSYDKSDDGLIWTFRLREGVKFHDGTDFNADAVKFSIERTIAGQKGSAYIWDPVDEINVLGPYEIEFVLSRPVAFDFVVSCANAAYIYSPTALEEFGDDFDAGTEWFSTGKVIGTGPYTLQSQIPGDEVIATQFSDYWGGWEGEHFDRIMFKLISEDASRRQMLESGEADVVTSLMVEDIEALESNPDIQIVVSDGITNMVAYLNTEKEPLNNKLVRQAVACAFPYDQVAEYVKKGFASVATGIIPQNMWGAMESWPYPHDLDRAKELLTEAGYPDGGFTLTYTYGAGREDRKKTAELFKSELAKIGVTLDIQAMPWDSQWAMAHNSNPNDRQDIFSTKYWSDTISPYDQYLSLCKSEDIPNWNLSYYENSEVDRLIEEAGVTASIDRPASIPTFRQIGEIVAEDCPMIPEGDQKSVMILSKTFSGYIPNAAYTDTVFFYECYRGE
jgi:peptide/nickel transport system substrate-binding protein